MSDTFIHHKEIDEYLNVIGKITINFANLEDEISKSIGILNGDDIGANLRIIAGEQFQRLLDLLETLFRYRISDRKQLKRFSNIISNASAIRNDRNENVHVAFNFLEIMAGLTIVTKSRYSKKGSDKYEYDSKVPSIEALKIIASDAINAKEELAAIINENLSIIKNHQKVMIENYKNAITPEELKKALELEREKHKHEEAQSNKHP